MELVIKDIPREFLALKINYCRQQLDMLPEAKLQIHNVKGIPTQKVIAGSQRLNVDSKAGKLLVAELKKREYYEHQLQIFETAWDYRYKTDPSSEFVPHKVVRKFYADASEPVIMDKAFFDNLTNDSDTRYSKPREYPFNGIYYRSAAEREIAMFYTEMGIPFKYEPEIMLKGLNEPIHPDFIIYIRELDNCKFHEHFGVKQSASYLKNTGFKYYNYTNAGLIPELDILFTHDISNMPFDIRVLAAKLNTAVYHTMISSPLVPMQNSVSNI